MKKITREDMDKLIKTLSVCEKNISLLKKTKSMPNLRRLTIKNIKQGDFDFFSLSSYDLDTLIFEKCVFRDLSFIRDIKTLYDITFKDCVIHDDLCFFYENQSYKSLTLKTDFITFRDFESICSYCEKKGMDFTFRNSKIYFVLGEDFYMIDKEKTTKDAFFDYIIKTMI